MLTLPALIIDLALILGSAAIVSLIFKFLKQPVVAGYIIAGLLISPYLKALPPILEIEDTKSWLNISLIFLLFTLGLEFSFRKLVKLNGVAIITALIELTLTWLLGFFVGKIVGWNDLNSIFLGGILAIASVTIIFRTFDDLGVKSQKFAEIVTGVMVVENLIAILLLILLSTIAISQSYAGNEMMISVLKLAIFLVLWFALSIYIIPVFLKKVSSYLNEEILLVLSFALCFGMVVLATYVGFSPALGAFIMGSIIAETAKAETIHHLTKPVKNLFGAVFFVSIGVMINPQIVLDYYFPILIATLVLLIGKPLFLSIGALASGQPLKIALQTGMSISQIGEFSFIIAVLGMSLGVISDFLFQVAVSVSVITIIIAPFMIRSSDSINQFLENHLPLKWKNTINKYSIGAQNISEINDWKKMLQSYFINVLVFSVIIVFLILLSRQYLRPMLSGHSWSQLITLILTLIIIAPFIWALAFRRTHHQAFVNVWNKTSHRGPLYVLLFLRMGLAVLFTGLILYIIYSPLIAILGIAISCFIIIILFGKIKTFFGKMEQPIPMDNKDKEINKTNNYNLLTPWDTHITSFELPSKCPYVGKTLAESKIREEFGINIVVIKRGNFVINIPGRDNHLYPNDKLSVIGTDEQFKKFKSYLETITNEAPKEDNTATVSLHHFTININSTLIDQSIRSSMIREKTHGVIIGIEREGKRILNPESDFIFKINDKVWIVGNKKRLKILFKDFKGK